MAEWKIKTTDKNPEDNEYSKDDSDEIESNDSEEENEELENSENESAPLEDMLQDVPSRSNFRFNRQGAGASPFLESEPIEDLEQSLKQTPTETKDNEKTKEPEQPLLYNAPQYSGSYDSGDYENTRKIADRELDISGGALTTRDTGMNFGEQRRMDFGAWQQQNMDQVQSQGEKYQVRKPEKFEQEQGLPFQDTKKQRRF